MGAHQLFQQPLRGLQLLPQVRQLRALLLASALEPSAESEDKNTQDTASAADEEKPSSVPEMNAEDTSATGMLRLEDLDARFAETIFGDDIKKAAAEAEAQSE